MTYKYVYEVTVKPLEDETQPGAFAGIDLGDEGYHELVNMPGYNEVYAIYTDRSIDRQLDLSDGVVSYRVFDGEGGEEIKD